MTSPIMKTRVRRLAVVGLALTVAGTLASCGSSPAKKTPGQSTSNGTQLASVWPLTGKDISSQPAHPVMIVKIPNTPDAIPQMGLSQADMISEELVEGGITRLAVYFDSVLPSVVGPVRSMRTSDIGLVKPAKGVLVSSGAAPATIGALNDAHVPFIQEDPSKGFYRASYPRIAPYNLLDRLNQTATYFRSLPRPVLPYFTFGPASTRYLGVPGTSIAVKFSGYRTTRFAYTGGHYVNTNAYSGNQPFLADNVVVLRVKEGNAGYLDPAGNPVPESVLWGKGSMVVFNKGVAVRGTWSKAGNSAPFVFRNAKGALLKLPIGRTYLELCPVNTAGGALSFR